MAAPVITAINSVAQGTGTGLQPKESVVQVSINFTADNPCNFVVQWSPNNGVSWFTATMHSAGSGLNVSPGSAVLLFIDVEKSRAAAGATASTWTTYKVRLTATDRVTSVSSTQVTQSGTSTVKSTRPVVLSFNLPLWVGQANANAAQFGFIGKDFDASNVLQDLVQQDGTHKMRLSTNLVDLDGGSSLAFASYNELGTFDFGLQPEGAYSVYLKIYDQFYNASDASSYATTLQRNAPSSCTIKLGGSSGSSDYTGIKINADGSFTPDRSVRVEVSAKSTNAKIPITFQIITSSDVELTGNVGIDFSLNAANAVQTVFMTTNRASPSGDNFNRDQTTAVAVTFKDAAGNQTTVSKAIRLNTRIYKATNKPLRRPDAAYRPLIKYVNSGGQEVFVPDTLVVSSQKVRSWADTYYPTTHGYPTDVDGNLDLDAVTADSTLVAGGATAQYDPILLTQQDTTYTAVTDEDGRVLTATWTKNGTKNYANMESNDVLSPRYWVLDNTGFPDTSLEFEFFDLDPNLYGPPHNRQSPYRGDVLVVYDATATGALSLDNSGVKPKYVLADSTKLKELAAYTGQGVNVANLTKGQTVNANANGGFITETFVNTPKLLLMLFTDFSGTASGFRLKSGPGRDKVFSNYDMDYTNGEVWVHMHSSLAQSGVSGSADTSEKRFSYDYLSNAPTINYSTGEIVFNISPLPTGNIGPWVEADWSYLTYDDGTLPGVNTFIASNDDLVDYNDAPVYVMPQDVPGYLLMTGSSGNGASSPESVDLTNDITITAKVSADSWSVLQTIWSQRLTSASSSGYCLRTTAAGAIEFYWGVGVSFTILTSSVASLPVGQPAWVRVSFQRNTGSGQYAAKFYTSTDGITFTQLGATQTGSSPTVNNSTEPFRIGTLGDGTEAFAGKFYFVEVRNGADNTGTMIVNPHWDRVGQGGLSNVYDEQGNLWTNSGTGTVIVPVATTITPTDTLKTLMYEINGQGRMVNTASWDKDRGVIEVSPSGVTPSGRRLTADYYAHTYTRLTNDGFGDLAFRDKIIVPDVITQFPDFTFADVKVVNEGNADLKDMTIKFVPRGYDTNSDGNVVLTGDAVVDQVLDINRPWDIQKGTKEETYEKMAMALRPSYDFIGKLAKSTGGSSDGLQPNATAVAILSTWQNRSYSVLAARSKVFGRVVWVLGGSGGSSYPNNITSGEKRCSLEVSGKYYSSLLI